MSWVSKLKKKMVKAIMKNATSRFLFVFGSGGLVFDPVGIMLWSATENEMQRLDDIQLERNLGINVLLDPDLSVIIKFAPYIESKHEVFLESVVSNRNNIINNSPFVGYNDIDISDSFFGVGYNISNFNSLYDMFSVHMIEIDHNVLWNSLFKTVMESPEIIDEFNAEAELINDSIVKDELIPLMVNYRNNNSINSSSFIINKALVESRMIKSVSVYGSNLKYELLPEIFNLYFSILNWHILIVNMYAQIMKLYYLALIDTFNRNFQMQAKDTLWPFTVLEKEQANIASLRGGMASSSSAEAMVRGYGSPVDIFMMVYTRAMRYYAMGRQVGGPGFGDVGGIIGGIIGVGWGLYDVYSYTDTTARFDPFDRGFSNQPLRNVFR